MYQPYIVVLFVAVQSCRCHNRWQTEIPAPRFNDRHVEALPTAEYHHGPSCEIRFIGLPRVMLSKLNEQRFSSWWTTCGRHRSTVVYPYVGAQGGWVMSTCHVSACHGHKITRSEVLDWPIIDKYHQSERNTEKPLSLFTSFSPIDNQLVSSTCAFVQ